MPSFFRCGAFQCRLRWLLVSMIPERGALRFLSSPGCLSGVALAYLWYTFLLLLKTNRRTVTKAKAVDVLVPAFAAS